MGTGPRKEGSGRESMWSPGERPQWEQGTGRCGNRVQPETPRVDDQMLAMRVAHDYATQFPCADVAQLVEQLIRNQ